MTYSFAHWYILIFKISYLSHRFNKLISRVIVDSCEMFRCILTRRCYEEKEKSQVILMRVILSIRRVSLSMLRGKYPRLRIGTFKEYIYPPDYFLTTHEM